MYPSVKKNYYSINSLIPKSQIIYFPMKLLDYPTYFSKYRILSGLISKWAMPSDYNYLKV
jgi:hypothetical protein